MGVCLGFLTSACSYIGENMSRVKHILVYSVIQAF